MKKKSFSISFPFGDKSESAILQSKLPDSIKNEYIKAKKINTTRYITVEVEDSKDVENVKKLIDLKIKN